MESGECRAQDLPDTEGVRRTRIIATIGPASADKKMIKAMIRAGMDIARLNLSHGTLADHRRIVTDIRDVSTEIGRAVAILTDLPGPKLRIRSLPCSDLVLEPGQEVVFSAQPGPNDIGMSPADCIPASYRGDTLLVADGALTLTIIEGDTCTIRAEVVSGGQIRTGAGVVIPGRRPEIPYTSDILLSNLAFAREIETDLIALSFVGEAGHITDVRELLALHNFSAPIIAKIETREAVTRFEEILSAADGIMVARGDLGVQLPISCVPHVQKDIITRSNKAGKPVITATEMLESMVQHSRPTRAEVTDVANAIMDGTDATMLSAETSVGKNPVQAIDMMARIACETERHLPYPQILEQRKVWHTSRPSEIISYSACFLANTLSCGAIVAFTRSGITAERVSRCRSRAPVLAITPDARVARRLLLRWGVIPVVHPAIRSEDELFAVSRQIAHEMGLADEGEQLVIIAGDFTGGERTSGTTNMIKVLKME